MVPESPYEVEKGPTIGGAKQQPFRRTRSHARGQSCSHGNTRVPSNAWDGNSCVPRNTRWPNAWLQQSTERDKPLLDAVSCRVNISTIYWENYMNMKTCKTEYICCMNAFFIFCSKLISIMNIINQCINLRKTRLLNDEVAYDLTCELNKWLRIWICKYIFYSNHTNWIAFIASINNKL